MENRNIPYKIYLDEADMPQAWYNLRADMKNKPAPLLNPGTGYFDMTDYQAFNDGKMTDYIPTDAELAQSIATHPKVPGLEYEDIQQRQSRLNAETAFVSRGIHHRRFALLFPRCLSAPALDPALVSDAFVFTRSEQQRENGCPCRVEKKYEICRSRADSHRRLRTVYNIAHQHCRRMHGENNKIKNKNGLRDLLPKTTV